MNLEYLYQIIVDNSSLIINLFIIFIVGIVLSLWLRGLVKIFFDSIRFEQALERTGWKTFLERTELKINFTNIFAIITQWCVLIIALMLATELLGLVLFFGILEQILLYFPNIFISIFIFTVSVYAIDFSQKLVVGSKSMNKIIYLRSLGRMADYSIKFLTILAICYQLKIIPDLILIVFIGVIATITISVGISLGLAAKKPMAQLLQEIKRSLFE